MFDFNSTKYYERMFKMGFGSKLASPFKPRRSWFSRFLRGRPTMGVVRTWSHSDIYLNSHVSWSYVDGAYRSTAPRFPGEPSAASPQLLCFRCMFVGTQPLTTACLSVCLSVCASLRASDCWRRQNPGCADPPHSRRHAHRSS